MGEPTVRPVDPSKQSANANKSGEVGDGNLLGLVFSPNTIQKKHLLYPTATTPTHLKFKHGASVAFFETSPSPYVNNRQLKRDGDSKGGIPDTHRKSQRVASSAFFETSPSPTVNSRGLVGSHVGVDCGSGGFLMSPSMQKPRITGRVERKGCRRVEWRGV